MVDLSWLFNTFFWYVGFFCCATLSVLFILYFLEFVFEQYAKTKKLKEFIVNNIDIMNHYGEGEEYLEFRREWKKRHSMVKG